MIHIQRAVGGVQVTEFPKSSEFLEHYLHSPPNSVPLVNSQDGLVRPDLAWHGSEKLLTVMTGLRLASQLEAQTLSPVR